MVSAILAYAVPVALVCLVVAYVGKSMGYVLLVPMVYEFGRAAYLNTYGLSVGPFGVDQIGLAVLVACCLVLVVVRPGNVRGRSLSYGLIAMAVYAFWLVVVAGLSVTEGLDPGKAALSSLFSMGIPISVSAWIVALLRVTEDELLGILRVIAGFSVVFGVLYVLQSRGVGVYPYSPYMSVASDGNVFVRDFLTFPFFAVPLALAWAVAERGRVRMRAVVVAVCLTAAAASFTRSILLASLFALVVPALIVARGRRSAASRRGLPVGIILAAGGATTAGVIAFGQFWTARFAGGLWDAGVAARVAAIAANLRGSSLLDALAGYGYGGGIAVNPGVVLGDSLWIGELYRFGLIGAFLLGAALLASMVDGLRNTLSGSGGRRTLAAVAVGLPGAALMLTLAGVPSSLHMGFAMALGPALALGGVSVPERAVARSGIRSLLPAWVSASAWRPIVLALSVSGVLALEVWLGVRLAR